MVDGNVSGARRGNTEEKVKYKLITNYEKYFPTFSYSQLLVIYFEICQGPPPFPSLNYHTFDFAPNPFFLDGV